MIKLWNFPSLQLLISTETVCLKLYLPSKNIWVLLFLRNTTDGVHGNFIGYRSMLQLKEDGSSYGTASSSEHWIQKSIL